MRISYVGKQTYAVYDAAGSPERVLIGIPGLTGCKESVKIQTAAWALASKRAVTVSYDLPMHGDNANTPLTVDNCLKQLDKTVEYVSEFFGGLPVSVFATSFGAYITLLYLLKFGNPFEKIILCSPAVNMADVLAKRLIPDFNKFIKNGSVDLGAEKNLTVTRSFYDELKRYDLFSMPLIDAETTIIQGDNDELVFCSDVRRYIFSKLPDADFRLLPGFGHSMDSPAEIQAIADILTNLFE